MKKLDSQSKILWRNHQIFIYLTATDKDFFRDILFWRNKLGVCKEDMGFVFEIENLDRKYKDINKYTKNLLSKIKSEIEIGKAIKRGSATLFCFYDIIRLCPEYKE